MFSISVLHRLPRLQRLLLRNQFAIWMDTPHDTFQPLEISAYRKPYYNMSEPYFIEENAAADPFLQFDAWFKDVCAHKDISYEEMNAVCLSTCVNNKPSSRMVLLKKYDKNGFSFFTNGCSRKGHELAVNPNAAMLFYWPFVNRQIRIEGQVEKLPVEEVENYWESRPLNSRIGGAISVQSSVIPSRKYLENKRAELNLLVAEQGHHVVKRPETWHGYTLKPVYFEFWQGQSDRIHDRITYKPDQNGQWIKERLSP